MPSHQQRTESSILLFQAGFLGQATPLYWQDVHISALTHAQAQKVCSEVRNLIVYRQRFRDSDASLRNAHATTERQNSELAMKLTKKTADLANNLIENKRLRKSIKKFEKAVDALSGALERSNIQTQIEGTDVTPTTTQKVLKTVIMEVVTEYNGAIMAHSCDQVVIDYHSLSAILVDNVPNHKEDKDEDQDSNEGGPTDDEDNGDISGVDEVQTGVQK